MIQKTSITLKCPPDSFCVESLCPEQFCIQVSVVQPSIFRLYGSFEHFHVSGIVKHIVFPFHWIILGDTGVQNYTGIRFTVLPDIIRKLYCVFTTPSQVFLHHHLSPLYPLLCPPSSSPGNQLLSKIDCFIDKYKLLHVNS